MGGVGWGTAGPAARNGRGARPRRPGDRVRGAGSGAGRCGRTRRPRGKAKGRRTNAALAGIPLEPHRSLRWHYPHQVPGVRAGWPVSAGVTPAPPRCFCPQYPAAWGSGQRSPGRDVVGCCSRNLLLPVTARSSSFGGTGPAGAERNRRRGSGGTRVRERLKPVVRAAFLLLFGAIAYLWQRRTGGAVLHLLGVAAGLVVVAVGGLLALTRLLQGLSGLPHGDAGDPTAGVGSGRPQAGAAASRPAGATGMGNVVQAGDTGRRPAGDRERGPAGSRRRGSRPGKRP